MCPSLHVAPRHGSRPPHHRHAASVAVTTEEAEEDAGVPRVTVALEVIEAEATMAQHCGDNH